MLFQLPIYHQNKDEEVRFSSTISLYIYLCYMYLLCALFMFSYVLVSYVFMF